MKKEEEGGRRVGQDIFPFLEGDPRAIAVAP